MKEKEFVTAIVLAAGRGTRMGTKIQKQYLDLCGKPVLYYSLHAFQESPLIDEILLVTGEQEIEYCRKEIVEKFDFQKVKKIVAGGAERFLSVYNGLKACTCDFVYIHDGARPFVDEPMLERVYAAVCKYEACLVGMPVKDTIKIADTAGFIKETPKRSLVWQIQTPQCFVTAEIREAYQKMMEAGDDSVTDDGMVMETYGIRGVRMIKGSYENMKITTPEDMLLGEAILKGRSTER